MEVLARTIGVSMNRTPIKPNQTLWVRSQKARP